ncbi:hypothetical protein G4V39_08595 [Thermosulfuriphilus ammonigenes]|uniref:Pyruvate phosphate dikinase AMP/ATP-binding domain-containing protein n=1 Tax=Thermosulfuriphilus ammonigenes TaxID=1936021 RepID=A0A6G7PXA6_9BACT|nr:PEP/pyruvate-binding domain-containing protein [Thermosulfuriphilus ammonigenes]MBA2849569.1 pyruvate,water dikinase [Thermosulfuriphilus ammonigenes]QIJ72325.1 hypothetical protein G4V39_08595 [Thermosulfuriphilus ammonigenes]
MKDSLWQKVKDWLFSKEEKSPPEEGQLARLFLGGGSPGLKRRNIALMDFLETRLLSLQVLEEIRFRLSRGTKPGWLKSRFEDLIFELKNNVRILNDLTENRYAWLFAHIEEIQKQISTIEEERGRILPLSSLDLTAAEVIGRPLAELAEARALGLPVPRGVVIIPETGPMGLNHQELEEILSNQDHGLWQERLGRLFGPELASVPEILEANKAIFLAFGHQEQGLLGLAATENPGQDSLQRTCGLALLAALEKRAYLGLPRAFFLPCLVVAKTKVIASGVFYSLDPRFPGENLALAVAFWGVGGIIEAGGGADVFLIDRHQKKIISGMSGSRKKGLFLVSEGLPEEKSLSPELQRLSPLEDRHLLRLWEYGQLLEAHFEGPREIRWLLEEGGRLRLVGIFPLKVSPPRLLESEAVLEAEVRPIGPGSLAGTFNQRSETESPLEIKPEALGLPPDLIEDQTLISLDTERGRLYRGWKRSLLKTKNPPLPDKWRFLFEIHIPLILGAEDPLVAVEAEEIIGPADILHLGLEAVFWESFHSPEALSLTHLLRDPRVPLSFYFLNLGRGLSSLAAFRREITISDILCRPFLDLWRGMTHEGVSWSGPVEFHLGGFLSVLSRSFVHRDVTQEGGRGFGILLPDYLFLRCRMAYHLLAVEVRKTEFPSHNYLFFRFGGGGAGAEGRIQRSLLLVDILRELDFRVETKADAVFAAFIEGREEEIAERLDQLGRLMGFTRQLDMPLQDEATRKRYVKAFFEGHYSLLEEPPDSPK